jgi:hypothetical protein
MPTPRARIHLIIRTYHYLSPLSHTASTMLATIIKTLAQNMKNNTPSNVS